MPRSRRRSRYWIAMFFCLFTAGCMGEFDHCYTEVFGKQIRVSRYERHDTTRWLINIDGQEYSTTNREITLYGTLAGVFLGVAGLVVLKSTRRSQPANL